MVAGCYGCDTLFHAGWAGWCGVDILTDLTIRQLLNCVGVFQRYASHNMYQLLSWWHRWSTRQNSHRSHSSSEVMGMWLVNHGRDWSVCLDPSVFLANASIVVASKRMSEKWLKSLLKEPQIMQKCPHTARHTRFIGTGFFDNNSG